jgi:Bacterial Ig-like domain (group 2)
MKSKLIFLALISCLSCVGVDLKDDAIRPTKLSVLASSKLMVLDDAGNVTSKGSTGQLALLAGEKQTISFEYLNRYGVEEKDKTPTWLSSKPSVATVTGNEVSALTKGTSILTASIDGANVTINLNVVGSSDDVASVTVAPPTTTALQIGQTVQLSAVAKNMNGTAITAGKTIEWFTENAAIVAVSTSGLVTAVANGDAEVHSKVDGIKSNSIKFSVGGSNVRTGTFQGAGGYSAKGTVTVSEASGKLSISVGADYQASVALGTNLYLANSTSGSAVKSGGVNLGQWSSGAKTFEVAGAKLNDYKYVVVLCQPAGITFGFAELKP